MTDRVVLAAIAVAISVFAASATAQPASAPAPAAATAAPIPKHNCGKPDEYPGNLASDTQRRTWQKGYVAYVDCLKKFVEDQQALAAPHVKASNEAIEEYNAAVKAYNETVQKASGG
jgi:hypothetical protein